MKKNKILLLKHFDFGVLQEDNAGTEDSQNALGQRFLNLVNELHPTQRMHVNVLISLGMYRAQSSFKVLCFTLKIHGNTAFCPILYVSI